MPPVDKEVEVMREVEDVHHYLNKGKYNTAYICCRLAYFDIDIVPEALESLSDVTPEERIKLAEEHIKDDSQHSGEVLSTPEGLLKAMHVSEAELYEAYKRNVNSKNFATAFYSARGLLMFGDPAGKPVFTKGLESDYFVYDFCPSDYSLNKAARREIYRYVAMQSAFALAEMGDSIAADYLKELLFNAGGDAKIRAYAAYSLSGFKEEGIIEALMQVSNDPAKEVRLESISGLSNFEDERLPDLFIAALSDGDAPVRAAAVFGLARHTSEDANITNLIIEVLSKEQDNNVKIACLDALGPSGQPNARDTVKRFLRSGDLQLKQAAVAALEGDLDEGSIQAIASMLIDQREEAKAMAALAAVSLSRYVDLYPRLREPLGKFLAEGDLDTRVGILSGFAQSDSVVGMEMAKSLLNDQKFFIRHRIIVDEIKQMSGGDLAASDIPLAHDSDWPVTLAAFQLINRKGLMPDMIEPVKRLSGNDVNPFVRAAALSTLGRVNTPEADFITTQALRDSNFVVRQGAVVGLADKVVSQPNFIENIGPLLDDPEWQVRQAAVQVVGKVELPQVPEMLAPRLQDPSKFVRQAAVESLGARVHNNPQLVDPFIERLKVESDPWTRQLTAWSLKTAQVPQAESVRPLIDQVVPQAAAVIIVPGVYRILQGRNDTGRDLGNDCTKDWQLRRILELGGTKVIEQRWTGKYSDVLPTMPLLENTTLKALGIAGERGRIMTIMYSGGNWVGRTYGSPNLHPTIKRAFDNNRISLISLESPSGYNFGQIDRSWRNVWSGWDPISRISEATSPNKHDIKINYFPDVTRNVLNSHFVFNDPRFTSLATHQAFSSLSMPQLPQMISNQNVNSWRYFPSKGDWPGKYSFGSIAPANFYLRNSTGLSPNPSPQKMQQFRAPDNYYLRQNLSQPLPKIDMPKIDFQEHALPNGSIYRQQPYYVPERGSWPGAYDFNTRAPDNYYKSPAATIPPYTPPPVQPYVPPMRNK
ncbi:MAG: HEAT repeat domain-containing protein [Candidatus Omnitrophota bacterium]|jgi:HEAT repeat protein